MTTISNIQIGTLPRDENPNRVITIVLNQSLTKNRTITKKKTVSCSRMDKTKKQVKPIDTLAITQSLGLQTFRKLSRRSWSKEDDIILLDRISQLYPELQTTPNFNINLVNWNFVAEAFEGARKSKDCKKRWMALLDPHLRRGRWTPEEDLILMELYKKYGPLWQQIARSIEGRTEHQCSKRYMEILDPGLRNRLRPWSEDEDLLLVKRVLQHGTKWKTIASELELRPPLTCRNRWRNLVTAIARGRASPTIVETISQVVDGDIKKYFIGLSLPVNQDIKMEDHTEETGRALSGAPTVSTVARKGVLKSSNDPLLDKLGYENQMGSVNLSSNPTYGASLTFGELTDEQGFDIKQENKNGQELSNQLNDDGAVVNDYHTSLSMSVDSPISNSGSGKGSLSSVIPSSSKEEWSYTLTRKEGEIFMPNESIGHSGTILSEKMVQYLLQHAAKYNATVNISHHVHHHYQNNQTRNINQLVDQTGFTAGEAALFGQNNGYKDMYVPPPATMTFSELDTHRKRRQHFNYLPPLMEVPRLTSSVVQTPPSSSTHHHHHHYHHHHSKDGSGAVADDSNEDLNAAKIDLQVNQIPLLKVVEPTPTQEELQTSIAKQLDEFDQFENLERPAKRSKVSEPDDGDELEFFESLRNLRATSSSIDPPKLTHNPIEPVADNRPVSQHHPLHYSNSAGIGNVESFFDDEAEDLIDSYGLFYHLYSNDPVPDKSLSEDTAPFGAIPFNPS